MRLAHKGAEHRLAELQAEIVALIKTFPHLRSSRSTPRKRKPMSPAARKAASERMKKYWAARRKARRA